MARGGARPGAGRKAQSGKFKEATKPVRVPVSLLPVVEETLAGYARLRRVKMGLGVGSMYTPAISEASRQALPLFSHRVAAGFPSPADDYIETALDLNEHLVRHPAATFFVRASGQSMLGAGIHSGDILVVDRSLAPRHNNIVIAVVNGELTVKRLVINGAEMVLVPENPEFPPLPIREGMDFQTWGVVTSVIHAL
jgi:DNA polymerase V